MGPFKAFGMLFSGLYTFFESFQHAMGGLNQLAIVAERSATHYANKTELENASDYRQTARQLEALEAANVVALPKE